MGSFLAASAGSFNPEVLFWATTTTVFLQILSNLANDYGDYANGADNVFRTGPKRAVQAGAISPVAMKTGIVIFAILSLISGIWLLVQTLAFSSSGTFGFFLVLGLLAVVAAIKYTSGSNPYGYAGFGDASVFLFFGLIGVLGTYYLHVKDLNYMLILPASSCGLFSAAVLNINNIRDIDSDRMAGKKSIPVRIGLWKARIYHLFLVISGTACAFLFVLFNYTSLWQFLFLIISPLLIYNVYKVYTFSSPSEIDKSLRQMAISTLAFVILFGIGNLIGQLKLL